MGFIVEAFVRGRRGFIGICPRRPLGPLDVNFSQHGPTTRPYVERTADTASLLSDRVSQCTTPMSAWKGIAVWGLEFEVRG